MPKTKPHVQKQTPTQPPRHLAGCVYEHDVYENHVVWSSAAMATFADHEGPAGRHVSPLRGQSPFKP